MEPPAFNLTDFKSHLVKKISTPNVPDQDRVTEKYLISIYKNSLEEMLKFAIHLVKDNTISYLTRLGIVEFIRNALMNKKNIEKIGDSLQLKEFLLCITNKVLSLPLNLKFSILRMFANVLNFWSVKNGAESKVFEFCEEFMRSLPQYQKEKNEDYLLIALWLSAQEVPKYKEILLQFLQTCRQDKDFELYSDETKFSVLNLEMQSVLWEDIYPSPNPAALLTNLTDILFKNLKQYLDNKKYDMALEHLILVWELFSDYPSDVTQDEKADKLIIKKTCSKLLDFFETYPEATWEVKKIILRILASLYVDDFASGLENYTLRVLTIMLNNFSEQFGEPNLENSLCFSGKITSELNLAASPDEYCIFHDNFERVGTFVSDNSIQKLFNKYKTGFDDWRKKCSFMIGIECFTVLSQKMIPYINYPTIAFLKDENPKVKHCAIRVVEEMAFYYESILDCETASQLVTILTGLLDDKNIRIQCLAASTLVTMSPKSKEKALELFMTVSPIIFKIIMKALEKDASVYPLVPDMLSCFSSLIPTIEDEFLKFHKNTFNVLFKLHDLSSGNPDLDNQIHGRIMEAESFSLINLKNSGEINEYKDKVIDFFLKHHGKIKNDLSPIDEYLITGWERLIEVFKGEIANYIVIVLNKLIPLSIKLIKESEDRCLMLELFERDLYFGKNHLERTGSLRDPDMVKSLCGFYTTFALRIPDESTKLAEKISLFLFQTIDCLETLVRRGAEEVANQTELYTDRYEDIYQEVYSASDSVLKAIEKSKHPDKSALHEKLGKKFIKKAWELYNTKKNFQDEYIHLLDWIYCLHKSMPKNTLTQEDIAIQTNFILEAWDQIQYIKFEDADANEENPGDVVNDEDLRYSICELASVIINNNEGQNHEMKIAMVKNIVQVIFQKYITSFDDDNFFTNELTQAMYLLVSIVEQSDLQFIMGNMDWQFLVEQTCKYATFRDNVLRQNACYMLGLLMEKSKNIPLNCTQPILTALLAARKVTYPPDSPFEDIGSFEECQDNLHAAIGKLIVSQHKYLPVLGPQPINPLDENTLGLNELIILWIKGLPLMVDVHEGHDHHPMFFEFFNENEVTLLGPEQCNSEIIFECLKRFLAEKHKILKKDGLTKFQDTIRKILENLDLYPKLKILFEQNQSTKDEFQEFSNIDVNSIKLEEVEEDSNE